MKKILFAALIFIGAAILNQSCTYDFEDDLYPICDTTAVSYNDDVLPIIDANCLGCHNSDDQEAGVVLEPHAELQAFALDGFIECVIEHAPGCTPMPVNGDKLEDCEITKIKIWIDEGALEN